MEKKHNLSHYLFLLLLLVIAVLLTVNILNHYYAKAILADSPGLLILYTFFFTVLNIIFGLKEVIIFDGVIEKKYRFNFILSIICLLAFSPIVACFSALIASLFYAPVNQWRQLKKISISNTFLYVFSLVISINMMSLTFFSLGGQVFVPNFPQNVFAILAGAAINFITNAFIATIWLKLYDFKSKIFAVIRKDFLWIIKYDLWQAIYALLVTNTLEYYFGDVFMQYAKSTSNSLEIRDFIILAGFIIVAYIFYFPIKEQRRAFNLLINFNRQNIHLKNLGERLKENNKRITRAFAAMLEKRDAYTSGHSERVALYSKIIAQKLNFNEEACEKLEMAALLHDIGKMGIDLSILNKNGDLADQEYNEIKKHPIYGVELLEKIYGTNKIDSNDEFSLICNIANSHHERYDGKGYPNGIKGEDISLEARIIAVADTLDAMTSDRSYREGMDFNLAIEEIKKNSGTQFCPRVVEAFCRCVEDGSLQVHKESDLHYKQLNIFE